MLATIQQIKDITPIENADAIETVKVLGWEVVVKKGEFKVNDLCIYIETDTLIPRKEWSEFLFKHPPKNTTVESGEGDVKEINLEYHRLITVRLRGQLSQGLVLPLNIIPHSSKSWNGNYYIHGIDDADTSLINIGQDVTEILGIKKYEKAFVPSNPKSGLQIKGNFPEFLRKTDEDNIQSYPILLEKLKGKPYYITLKLDGMSATYYKDKGKFGVCSRKLEIKNPLEYPLKERIKDFFNKLFGHKSYRNKKKHDMNVYWRMAYKYKIMDLLPDGYAIQGEICGPSIQGNKMGLKENDLFIFNVFDINKQKYTLVPLEEDYLSKKWDGFSCYTNFVPMLEDGHEFNYTMEQLINMANELIYSNGEPAEGMVVRSLDQTISFKVKNNRFLLKYGE